MTNLFLEPTPQESGCMECCNGTTTSNSNSNPWTYQQHRNRQRQQQGIQRNNNNNEDVDLAREMNELSFEEREKVLEEVHGVDKTREETPEFVAASIEAFDQALSSRSRTKRSRAMERAFFLRPGLKTNNNTHFKLLFLRAEYFDAPKAADRMARYFESKLTLFGIEKLAKDITLEDLSPKDVQVGFTSGCYMVELPLKDRSGRPILFADARNYDFVNYLNLVRTVYYYKNGRSPDHHPIFVPCS
jgi:hypothetical protein